MKSTQPHHPMISALALTTALVLPTTMACSGDDSSGSSNTTDMISGTTTAPPPSGGTAGTTAPGTAAPAPPPFVPPAGPVACSAPNAEGVTAISANALNNYRFDSTLHFDVSVVKSNTELTLDWTGLTKDFLQHDVTPLTDIDMTLIVIWKMSPDELAQKMNADTLAQADTASFAMIYSNDAFTSSSIFNAQVFEMALTPEQVLGAFDAASYPASQYTFTAMTRTGVETSGLGTRMIKAFKIDPAAEDTVVTIDNNSTTLTWKAYLTTATPTYVPAASSNISIAWSDMTTTALNTTFKPTKIKEVLVAHYAETETELETKFLDLDRIALNEWRAPVEIGTSINLGALTDANGAPFAGIDDTGTWLVGLVCSDCSNPAPWYLSPLKTCTP